MVMSYKYQVLVKRADDWHFATCKSLPGLFVAHREYQKVLDNIPECITMLIKNDLGIDVSVSETKPTEPTLLGDLTFIATKQDAA
jgi:hypothetical protein